MPQADLNRRTLTVVVLGLIPSIWMAWLLWFAPLDGLMADRTALAARDFTALWAAGQAAAEHSLAVLSDPATFTDYLRTMFGPGIPNQIWPYPPPILLLARPLSAVPLGLGFVLYSIGSLATLWLAMSLGGLSVIARAAVLLSPAVAANALAGQNGALISALLCGGLLLIDRRPGLAGLMLGALIIKPQFALLLPVCLLAGCYWRPALFGCMSSFALAFLSAYVFGYTPWVDFLSGNQNNISAYIGAPWRSDPAQLIFSSAFMATRSLGGGLSAAYLIQAMVTCGCAYCAWQVWRSPHVSTRARTAATLPLILLAAPWVHSYDMPALAVSIALLIPRSGTIQRALLAVAWLWPGLPPMIPFPPPLAVLSIGCVAWCATSFARRGYGALRLA